MAAPPPEKMDLVRALSLMGLSNNRWMDASSGGDPKAALDKALFEQMQNLDKKRTMKVVRILPVFVYFAAVSPRAVGFALGGRY
jgi:hypothetical protein